MSSPKPRSARRQATREPTPDDVGPSALLRVFHLHQLLCDGRKVTASRLMRDLDTSLSSIRRTVKWMKQAFCAPIEWDGMSGTYRYTRACDYLPIVKLELKEAMMLVFGAHALGGCGGTDVGGPMLSAVRKLMPLLGSVATYPPEQLAQAVAVPPKARVAELRFFDRLVTAILERRVLQVNYRKPGAKVLEWRELQPLRLAPRRDKWILIAHSVKDGEVRNYLLMRMHEVKFTGATFEPPAGAEVDAHLRASMGRFVGGEEIDVHVIADPIAHDYLDEAPLHADSQRITVRPDGRLDVRLRTSSRQELRNELLRWSELIEVVSPADLRAEVCEVHRRAVARYEAISEQ